MFFGCRNKIRPKLQFGEHQERRPLSPNSGPHRPTEIQRTVEHSEVDVFFSGQLVTSAAGRRYDKLPSDMFATELRQQGRKQIYFADAHGMEPDANSVAIASRHQTEELLVISGAVFTRAD
jgi:hypothetical protein